MPAYNFKDRFADLVASGAKPHTIRPRRKRPTVVGDTLYLYTGMRTRACRLLRTTVCTAVTPILIGGDGFGKGDVRLADRFLNWEEIEQLARRDGFARAVDFFAFFHTTYGPTFTGELIAWQP